MRRPIVTTWIAEHVRHALLDGAEEVGDAQEPAGVWRGKVNRATSRSSGAAGSQTTRSSPSPLAG
jgi:hypothetical protein